jgi:hypothetical protein
MRASVRELNTSATTQGSLFAPSPADRIAPPWRWGSIHEASSRRIRNTT